MSAVASKSGRQGIALLVALTLILSLVAIAAPFAEEAKATHGARTLDVEIETDTQTVGTNTTVTATLSASTTENLQVDFEIDCITGCRAGTGYTFTGGQAGAPDTAVEGNQAMGTADDTPNAPDRSCLVLNGTDSCSFQYTRNTSGQDFVYGWIDHDGLNGNEPGGFTERDSTEEPASTGGTPEPDLTDAVTRNWNPGTGTLLDCDDNNGAGDDTETNPVTGSGSLEIYRCTVQDAGGNPVQSVFVQAENLNGPNDPDNSAAAGDADRGTAGDTTAHMPDSVGFGTGRDCAWDSTNSSGQCNLAVDSADGETGPADICFWISNDGQDDQFDPAGSADDGGDCDVEGVGEGENNDQTDKVTKTWAAGVATSIDCNPENDTNSIGQSHTITCNVDDQFGANAPGANVDGEVLAGSVNDPQNDGTASPPDHNNLNTDANGNVSVTYSGANAGTDTFCFWIDNAGTDTDIDNGGTCAGDSNTDVVTKTWETGQADQLDCFPETDANLRTSSHTFTCDGPANGVVVKVEATGANDPDGNNDFASPDFTCTISGGDCDITHDPAQDNVGVTTYRAWVGNAPDATEGRDEDAVPGSTFEDDNTDVVEKRWHGVASTLTMTPASDAAALGTCNVFTVTLTDASSPIQPVGNAIIDIRQTHQGFNTADATDNGDPGFCTEAEVVAADPSAPNPSNVTEYDNGTDGRSGGQTTDGTDANGQVSYGIELDNTIQGTVEVLAFCEDAGECPNAVADNSPAANELQDISTKTWGAGGADGVENVVCTPDSDTNPANTTHGFTCTLTNTAGSPIPGVTPVADITAGPNANEPAANPTCDASDSSGVSRCAYTDAGASPIGTDTIEVWVQQSASSGGGTAARDAGEPFDTITKAWTTPPTGLILNLTCDDSNGPSKDATADDDLNADLSDEAAEGSDCQNPLASTNETFTALVTDPRGTGDVRDDVPVAGIQVEFTIADPFCFFGDCGFFGQIEGETAADIGFVPPGGGSNGPVYCTTGADGRCSVTVNNPSPESFDHVFIEANIFGQTNEGSFGNSEDAAWKEWFAAGVAANLVLSPQGATNKTGTQHTLTATVTDVFGNPVQGVNVDFSIEDGSRNDPNPPNTDPVEGVDRTTNAAGQATFTYTDTGPLATEGEDTIVAWADVNPENDENDGEPQDTARKVWQTQPGNVTTMKLDMQMDDDLSDDDCPTNIAEVGSNNFDFEGWNDNAVGPNQVSTAFPHEVCAAAYDETNRIIVGGSITFTIVSGPGFFTNAAGANLGATVTRAVNQDGHALTAINSATTGTTTVRATSGTVSDQGTKQWVSLPPRTLDCEPETATNDPSQTHLVQCTARDLNGNPVAGWQVFGTESGVGRIQPTGGLACDPLTTGSPDTCIQVTNGQGVAPFTLENPQRVEGTQSFTAELASDDNDFTRASDEVGVDECERPAGNPAGAPAGVCTDTVTKTWKTATTPPPTTAPPGGFPVDITLDASKNTLRFGKSFNLSGSISPIEGNTPPACVNNRTVILERVVTGTTATVEVATTTTDANGVFTFTLDADKNATYVARVEPIGATGGETCDDAASAGEEVRVKKKVTLTVSKKNVSKGTLVRLHVKVAPCAGHRGDRITLWKSVAGTMAKVGTKDSNQNCAANFFRKVRKDSVYQGRSPKQDADHQSGKSTRQAVLVN